MDGPERDTLRKELSALEEALQADRREFDRRWQSIRTEMESGASRSRAGRDNAKGRWILPAAAFFLCSAIILSVTNIFARIGSAASAIAILFWLWAIVKR